MKSLHISCYEFSLKVLFLHVVKFIYKLLKSRIRYCRDAVLWSYSFALVRFVSNS